MYSNEILMKVIRDPFLYSDFYNLSHDLLL